MERLKRTLLLAAPRGFCAGVDRAIQIVERALEKYGAPVYVRHEIVHNRFVVENLEKKGAVFVDELSDVPKDVPVIFSAHGVAKSVPQEAEGRQMFYIDATCPLVSKVHREAERHDKDNLEIVLIGHRGHPEVIGTMGQLRDGKITLIETAEEATAFVPKQQHKGLAYLTQTTLSVDETKDIVDILKKRFPDIQNPKKEDICYATTNRQAAVKVLAQHCDGLLVIGAPNSSNSMRLVEVGQKSGCQNVALVQRATDIPWVLLQDSETIGITAGASAPETLVEEVVTAFSDRYDIVVEEIVTQKEQVVFKMPRILE
jgi:4-hydroxy-3-methylbut-2-en-1-yl diphosphate reductase